MHEISLAEEVLRIIEESSVQEGFVQVRSFTLEVGQLAGVDPQALSFALEHVGSGSIIQGAKIDFQPLPGSGYCASCKMRVPLDFALAPCHQCGQQPLAKLKGNDLRLLHLDVV